jgi:hypothetical protein
MFSSGPNTLLRRGCPPIIADFFGQKDPFELDHSGIAEEQGGIVFGDE